MLRPRGQKIPLSRTILDSSVRWSRSTQTSFARRRHYCNMSYGGRDPRYEGYEFWRPCVPPATHPGLAPLQQILEGPTARFCCGGVAPLPGPVRIYDDRPNHVEFPGATGDELQRLSDMGEQAKFGKGAETVLDTSYRRASKIGPANFGIGGFSPDLLLNEICHIMAPEAPAGLRAELHGLSVYGEGGMFKPHADTPRGTTHIGSLVVCLAAPFSGGTLAVRHGGVEVAFEWASAASSGADEVQWCAFYSDVEHEVLPVTSGHRVTLAYNLYLQPSCQELLPLGGKPLSPDTLPVHGVLRALLADPGFYPDGIKLGFFCSHRCRNWARSPIPRAI